MAILDHLKLSAAPPADAESNEKPKGSSHPPREKHSPSNKQDKHEEKRHDDKANDATTVKGKLLDALSSDSQDDVKYDAKRSSRSAIAPSATGSVRRSNTTGPTRPGMHRQTTVQTQYIQMLLSLDAIPRLHNLLASFFTWLLLAGYVVFPATFTSLNKKLTPDRNSSNVVEQQVASAVKNVPLLYIAAFCCGVGALGCAVLWRLHRGNYVWLLNRIFLPSLLNALAGLIGTLVNVYSAQDGEMSVTARVTVVVTSACAAVMAGLFVVYNWGMLRGVKRRHAKETEGVGLEGGMQGKDSGSGKKGKGNKKAVGVGGAVGGVVGMEVGSGRI